MLYYYTKSCRVKVNNIFFAFVNGLTRKSCVNMYTIHFSPNELWLMQLSILFLQFLSFESWEFLFKLSR